MNSFRGKKYISVEISEFNFGHFCLILVSQRPVCGEIRAAAVKAVAQEMSAAPGGPHRGCSVVSVWGGHLFFPLKNFHILC